MITKISARRRAWPILFYAVRTLAIATLLYITSSGVHAETIITKKHFGMHVSSLIYQPWPSADFGTLRTWDQWPNITWANINPAPDVYVWNALDKIVDTAQERGVDIIYTFGATPRWAVLSGSGSGCAQEGLACDAPSINSWKNFVSAITKRYAGRIKYWELWNEPNSPTFWRGTLHELVTMAEVAYPIIKATGGVILSPAPQGRNAYKWLDNYFIAGGNDYTDIIAFHGYFYGAPENIIDFSENLKQVVDRYDDLRNKPIWDTEHSWGNSDWPFGASQKQQAAWLARFIPLSFASGIKRSVWYMWDGYDNKPQHWGMLFNATRKQLLGPGRAYHQVYDWLVGATLDGCTEKAEIYSCPLSRLGGYEALLVWVATAAPALIKPFTAPEQYDQYRTLDGATVPIPKNRKVSLTMQPILLEHLATDATN